MRLISIGIVLCMAACQNSPNSDTKQLASPETVVGADKDEFGCIGSAGYRWSVLKDTCIRAFEAGTPFVKYDVGTGATDSSNVAYVLLSDDRQKAEVFLGTQNKPVVMDALPVMEGETMPVLFENKTEKVQLRSHRETYQLIFLDTLRYLQHYNAEIGLGKWLKK